MKALKIIFTALIIILLIAYLLFLFVLPTFLKINSYTYNIDDTKNLQKGLVINAEKIKLLTSWNLSVGVNIKQIEGYYKTGEKFAQVDNLKISISIPYLILKKVKLDKISVNSIITHLDLKKDGTFEIEEFIPQNETNNTNQNLMNYLPYGLQFSENMPNIEIKKYSIALKDLSNKKKYSLKGKNLKISDFNLNKKFKFQTEGHVTLDGNEQFKYNLNIHSFIFPEFATNTNNDDKQHFNILPVLENLNRLNLKADILADIKIKGTILEPKFYGKVDINELSTKVKNQQLPNSRLKLNLDNDKIYINSDFYTSLNEKTSLEGYFKHGKNQYIDLNIKNNKLSLNNLFNLVNTVLPTLGIKELETLNANGFINADFSVKSDFKTINSSGYLKITDANIYYSLYNIALRNIQANIDFSQNQINIKKANAICNGAPLIINGSINSNAYANVNILANKIPLKAVVAALGQINLLNENHFKSGFVTLNGVIKGNLKTVKPEININLENINLYNKPNKAEILLSSAKIIAKTSGVNTSGNGNIRGLKILIKGLPTFSIPNSKISFNEKDLNLDDIYILINNSKIKLLGGIQNYSSQNANINITAAGMVDCNDIKNSLDRNIRSYIKAKGRLPLAVSVTGNNKTQTIKGQILANNANYLSLLDINSLYNKTSLLNVLLKVENNSLKINDLSLNALTTNKGLSDNFEKNLANSSKVFTAKGTVGNLSGKTQLLQGINISIPNQITFAIPDFTNSKIQIKGDINISGTTANPIVTGMLNIPNLHIPTIGVYGKNLTINTTKNIIDVFCNQLNVANSTMNIVATINNNFKNGIYIKSLLFNSTNLDVDSLSQMMAKLPQNTIAPGTNAAVTITNGKGKIDRLQSGNIVVTNVTSNFSMANNIFKLPNIEAMAYGGKIAGNATYNLLYANSSINMQGRNLNSQAAMYAFTGVKNLMSGTLDFDAFNLTTRGLTDTQIIQSLKGNVNFMVSHGQMGTLGKLENLLYAQNILANNLLRTTIGAVAGAVKIKKTGNFKYIKGTAKLANGWVYLKKIQVSGQAMSMYITGKYNLLNNNAELIILGRLSDEVVSVLGPIGSFSVNSLISSIPKIGTITSSLINQMTTNPSGENVSLLPELDPYQANTKIFKAAINGSVESTRSIKYFKWLSTPKATTGNNDNITNENKNTTQQNVTQQMVTSVKNQAQNAINKVLDIQTMTNYNNLQKNSVPNDNSAPLNDNDVADFINKLPDLNLNK